MYQFRKLLVLIIFSSASLQSQENKVHTIPLVTDLPAITGSLAGLDSLPPTFNLLPNGPGARNGKIWIRNTGKSLRIYGQVNGPTPQWPSAATNLLGKDHVELWLSTTPELSLPPIGWGNQFDQIELPNGTVSCDDWAKNPNNSPGAGEKGLQECRDWASKQVGFRNTFRRLFARQWLLAGDFANESYATPAYDSIVSNYADKDAKGNVLYFDILNPTLDSPAARPRLKVQNSDSGYTFSIDVPFGSFPPANSLQLRDLWVEVDVFSSAPAGRKMGAFSMSSSNRQFGKPATWNHLQLVPSPTFHDGACDTPLRAANKYGADLPAWYLPGAAEADGRLKQIFIITNPAQGYAYTPQESSPSIEKTDLFWTSVGTDEWICGPDLAYRKGSNAVTFKQTVEQDNFGGKYLPDGTLLIHDGPAVYWSKFGSGQCGACPRYELNMFSLNPAMKLESQLQLNGIVGGDVDDADIVVTPDWTKITHYQHKTDYQANTDRWTSTSYCLQGHTYKECGAQEGVAPPEPRNLKELKTVE